MPERSVEVASRIGLHARPAALFCEAAAASGITVMITGPDGTSTNAASILGVLALGVDHGDSVTLSAEGDGSDAALDSLAELLRSDLDAR